MYIRISRAIFWKQRFWISGSGWGLRFCLSHQLPGGAMLLAPGPHLKQQGPRAPADNICSLSPKHSPHCFFRFRTIIFPLGTCPCIPVLDQTVLSTQAWNITRAWSLWKVQGSWDEARVSEMQVWGTAEPTQSLLTSSGAFLGLSLTMAQASPSANS